MTLAYERNYDARTAVTFLLAGLGIGTLAALLLRPKTQRSVIITSGAQRRGEVATET